MAANTLLFSPISLRFPHYVDAKRNKAPSFLPWSSVFCNKLVIRPQSNSTRFVRKYRSSATATVSFSLPVTVKPETASPEKFPNWSARAIRSFAMAELEARKLKYPNTGTEALLMGILVEGTSTIAKFLRANGITLFKPERPPLTKQAQRVLDWAVNEKLKSGESGEITTNHLLLGIWSEKESAGHKILTTVGFNDEKAKEITKSINEDTVLSF